MSKQLFKFKQFTIFQDKCAMKVGTDGVLLGAWSNIPLKGNICDIGTGTGLLALMIAQRSEAKIIAVELNSEAAAQAKDNCNASSWAEQIDVVNTNISDINPLTLFDYIISNPPFFSKSLHTPDISRSMARHQLGLSVEDLLHQVVRLLNKKGLFACIYPINEANLLIMLAENIGLHCQRKTLVFSTPNKPAHRVLMEFSYKYATCIVDELIIEIGGRHVYSEEYIKLTKGYYL